MTRVSLKDVAGKVGVSVATVSLALRGKGEVAKETAAEVQRVAREMGYRPNPVLASLASKRFSEARLLEGTGLALLEFPILPGGTQEKESQYRRFLVEEADRLGYAISVYLAKDMEDVAALYHKLYHRAVQGILVTGHFDPATWGDAFDWGSFSVVQCARYGSTGPFHTVRPNIFWSVKKIFHQLLARGYRRIGFGMGRHETILEDDEDRHGSAVALMTEHLKKSEHVPVFLGRNEDREAFLKWFKAHKPEAVVGFTSGHYWALKEAGYRMPEDVGFVALNQTEPVSAGVAGMRQHAEEIARQAILLLDQRVRHHDRGFSEYPLDVLVPYVWEEGVTLKPM